MKIVDLDTFVIGDEKREADGKRGKKEGSRGEKREAEGKRGKEREKREKEEIRGIIDFSDLHYSLMILADKNPFEGKCIKKVKNDLPPPPLYRKCIKSSLKLCKTLRKKQGGKISKKITVRGKKSRSG